MEEDNNFIESFREETMANAFFQGESRCSDKEENDDDVTVIEDSSEPISNELSQSYRRNEESSNSGSNILIINLDATRSPRLSSAHSPLCATSLNSGLDVQSEIQKITDKAESEVLEEFQGKDVTGVNGFPLQEETGASTLSPFAETFGPSIHSWRQQGPPLLPPMSPCHNFQDLEIVRPSTSTWCSSEPQFMAANNDIMMRALQDEAKSKEIGWCGHAFDHSRAYSGYNNNYLPETLLSYCHPSWSNVNNGGCWSSLDGPYTDDTQYPLGSAMHPIKNWQLPQTNSISQLPTYADAIHGIVMPTTPPEAPTSYWSEYPEQFHSESHDDSPEACQSRLSSLHTPPPLKCFDTSPPSQHEDSAVSEATDDDTISKVPSFSDRTFSNFSKEPVDLRIVGNSLQPFSTAEVIPSMSDPVTTLAPSVNFLQHSTTHDKNQLMTCYMVYPINGINSLRPRLLTPNFQQPAKQTRPQPPRYITVREMLAERSRTQSEKKVPTSTPSVQIPKVCSRTTVSAATTCHTTSLSLPSTSSSLCQPALSLREQFPITSALLGQPRIATGPPAGKSVILYPVNPPKSLSSQDTVPQLLPLSHTISCNATINSSSHLASYLSFQPAKFDVATNVMPLPSQNKQTTNSTEDKTASAVSSTENHIWKPDKLSKNKLQCRSNAPKPLHFDVQHLFIGKFKVEVYATKGVKLLNRLKVLFSKRLFVYEFDIPDKVGDLGASQSKVAAIQVPFSSVVALHCDSHLVQVKVKSAPDMFLGTRRLQTHTGGGNIQYNKSEKVDLTGGELARYPLHELLLRKEEAGRLRKSLEEFDCNFKKKMSNLITVECQEPEPKSLTHMMIEQPTVESIGDSGQQWKRFCLSLGHQASSQPEVDLSVASIP